MRLLLVLVSLVACGKDDRDSKSQLPFGQQKPVIGDPKSGKTNPVTPPMDLKQPPADAVKTASGLVYKKLVEKPDSVAAKRNDTVTINYNGWRQATGDTFYSSWEREAPMPLSLATSAPGFTEILTILKKGEKAMVWIPGPIGYKPPIPKDAEMLVYEIEVLEIQPAPAQPTDLAPPATAQALPSGGKIVIVKPGTGTDRPRSFDTVTYDYSAWDSSGRMFDTTELKKKPVIEMPFRRTAALEEALTQLVVGARARFWVDAAKMDVSVQNPPTGMLTYEIELKQLIKSTVEPPPVPTDVKAPPPGTKKTPKGVSYRLLSSSAGAGKGGPKPKATDTVRIHYTAWTTEGRMFDSSVVRGEPAEQSLKGGPGWVDGIPMMSVGDKMRFWVPAELGYKNMPGRPQGMLVFDIELVEIKPKLDKQGRPMQPPPPDVAAAPKDAKKSPKGVAYKILTKGKGGPHPTSTDKVRVQYTGWTTDGEMFDTSVGKPKPAEFKLTGVVAGWTDGIPMLEVGDKGRLWIPEALAYPNGGGPKGDLVFDVELIEIVKE